MGGTKLLHKRIVKKVTAVILSLTLLFAVFPAGAFIAIATQIRDPLQVGVISDIHYFPQSLTGGNCQAFLDYSNLSTDQIGESESLLNTALDVIKIYAQQNGMKYLFIPGDITKDGQYQAHVELAQRLEQFEQETGIEVFVINGNHDLNCHKAVTFENGYKENAKITTPEQWLDIYKNLGYDHSYNTYTPPEGEKSGMLSYSSRLDGGYRLIAMDVCKYSADATESGMDSHETGGNMSEGLMQWVISEIEDAERCGEEVIGMMHHSASPHYGIQKALLQGFTIDNWLEVSETLADAGMHYVFTGHIHMSDVCSHVSDNGEVLYDISTASLAGYPNTFKEVLFEEDADGFTADIETFDVDCEENVVVGDIVYEKPYKYTHSFGQTYGHEGINQFGKDMVADIIYNLFGDINENGGLIAQISDMGLDLEKVFSDLLGEGLKIGNIDIFTYKNLMSFVNALANQIDENYIQQPERVVQLANLAIDKLLSIRVSDVPCTKFIDTIGFGDPNKGGTLEDFGMTMIAYYAEGDEDISDDEFAKSVLYNLENGDVVQSIVDVLIEIIIDDVLQNDILSTLQIELSSIFVNKLTKRTIGSLLDFLLNIALGGDKSFRNLIDFVFRLGVLPYSSIHDILDHYMDEYLTYSQLESIGITMAELAGSFMIDDNPGELMDNFVKLRYNGPVEVIPTAEDYRLPSLVAVTFGDNAETDRNFSWYTKYSVTGTDIEIVPYSENPQFRGVPTTRDNIQAYTNQVNREYPGVDIGIFGFLPYTENLIRHTIKLSGLETGEKYCYRIGDASKGWWSDVGVIETNDNSDSFAFLHMTDSQSQNEKQYLRGWSKTVSTAFDMFPESDFIVHTGDAVDAGKNVNQWKWLFNTASDDLLNTVMMPTAGNHENKGAAITENFLLTNIPRQSLESGVYYSFDYNNAHFMVLNTNDFDENDKLSQQQIDWLRQDAHSSNAQWKILALHKAVYSNGSHFDDKEIINMREQLNTLMPELGIDVVLQGHDHVYMRTGVMNNNEVVETQEEDVTYNGRTYSAKMQPRGTIYSIPSTCGVKFYNAKKTEMTNKLFPQAESIVETQNPVFASYHIEDNILYYDAYIVEDGSANRIDSFAIVKEKVDRKTFVTAIDDANNGITPKVMAIQYENEGDLNVEEVDNSNPQTGDTILILVGTLPVFAASAVFVLTLRKRKKNNI